MCGFQRCEHLLDYLADDFSITIPCPFSSIKSIQGTMGRRTLEYNPTSTPIVENGRKSLGYEAKGGVSRFFDGSLGLRGFVPGRRVPFVSAKGTKTIDAPSGFLGGERR